MKDEWSSDAIPLHHLCHTYFTLHYLLLLTRKKLARRDGNNFVARLIKNFFIFLCYFFNTLRSLCVWSNELRLIFILKQNLDRQSSWINIFNSVFSEISKKLQVNVFSSDGTVWDIENFLSSIPADRRHQYRYTRYRVMFVTVFMKTFTKSAGTQAIVYANTASFKPPSSICEI